jgi:adenosine deaminase
MSDVADREWLLGLPKAEVHVHLEGSLPLVTIAAAARRNGERTPDDPHDLLGFDDLAGLLAFLDYSCRLMTEPDELELVAYQLCERAAASGVVHSDVIFNPTHWPSWRDDLTGFVDSLDAGFKAACADGLPSADLCLSLKRTQTQSEAMELVDWMSATRPASLVALSVDGNEAATGRTGERFAPVYERARRAGFRRCAHAGESSGPEGVRDAIELLRVERIDHGVRAVEDPALVAELADRRIPLDVCPTSNVRLGIAPSLAEHPIEQLRRAGVPVSVNTDDPILFSCDVIGEYERCAQQFGWTRQQAKDIARTSIESCFADDSQRAAFLADLDAYPL